MTETSNTAFRPILGAALRATQFLIFDLLCQIPYGGGPGNRMVFTAMALANIGSVYEDPELRRLYGALDALPPDKIRTPVTISALAKSTGMPFESVRRRVKGMVDSGICEVSPQGVRLLSCAVEPYLGSVVGTVYEFTRVLYRRLKETGCLPPLPSEKKTPALALSSAPMVSHLCLAHLLRLLSAVGRTHGDLTVTLIILVIACENTRHVADLPATLFSDGLTPDELKVPITSVAIAEILGLGESTVSGRVSKLVRSGVCLRRRGGVIFSQTMSNSADVAKLVAYNYMSLQQLLEPLHEHGVLALWDAEAEADSASGGSHASVFDTPRETSVFGQDSDAFE